MKKVLNFLIVLTFLLAISCNSDDPDIICCTNIDTGITFGIDNRQGEDLLNPETPDAIDPAEIKLFYLINGEKQEVYNSNMDFPRNFNVFYHDLKERYVISVFQNSEETEENPITYIQWNEEDTDTLRATYRRAPGLVQVTKTWLNDELIWEIESGTEAYYELEK